MWIVYVICLLLIECYSSTPGREPEQLELVDKNTTVPILITEDDKFNVIEVTTATNFEVKDSVKSAKQNNTTDKKIDDIILETIARYSFTEYDDTSEDMLEQNISGTNFLSQRDQIHQVIKHSKQSLESEKKKSISFDNWSDQGTKSNVQKIHRKRRDDYSKDILNNTESLYTTDRYAERFPYEIPKVSKKLKEFARTYNESILQRSTIPVHEQLKDSQKFTRYAQQFSDDSRKVREELVTLPDSSRQRKQAERFRRMYETVSGKPLEEEKKEFKNFTTIHAETIILNAPPWRIDIVKENENMKLLPDTYTTADYDKFNDIVDISINGTYSNSSVDKPSTSINITEEQKESSESVELAKFLNTHEKPKVTEVHSKKMTKVDFSDKRKESIVIGMGEIIKAFSNSSTKEASIKSNKTTDDFPSHSLIGLVDQKALPNSSDKLFATVNDKTYFDIQNNQNISKDFSLGYGPINIESDLDSPSSAKKIFKRQWFFPIRTRNKLDQNASLDSIAMEIDTQQLTPDLLDFLDPLASLEFLDHETIDKVSIQEINPLENNSNKKLSSTTAVPSKSSSFKPLDTNRLEERSSIQRINYNNEEPNYLGRTLFVAVHVYSAIQRSTETLLDIFRQVFS